jgi:hypothetical protein
MFGSLKKLSSNASISVTTGEELLFLIAHLYVLSQNFVCVYEIPSSVPGFAPSLKG